MAAKQMIRIRLQAFDHRVLDGADAARFLSHIITLLEDPMRMLVEVA